MDVIEIAKQRRTNLAKEIARLDEFIRMGEELSKSARSESGRDTAQSGSGGANTIRQFSSENAAAAAAKG